MWKFGGKRARSVFGLGAALLLAGCVTLTPELQLSLCQPIETALETPPETLKTLADTGDAPAQYSYAIVLRYGLNGVTRDTERASEYLRKSIGQRGTTMMPIYVPATGKVPGHMMFINQSVYAPNRPNARVVEDCLGLLDSDMPEAAFAEQLNAGVCGGAQNYLRLKDKWRQALAR